MRALERRLLAPRKRDRRSGAPVRWRRPLPDAGGPGTIDSVPRARRSGALSSCRGGLVKLVVGLGNPGSQYARTRHNIGWLVLDRIADRAGWNGRGRQRDASNVVSGRYRGLDLTLVKPLTYMNESGIAVRKVLARERAPLNDLLVVTDDFALPFGKLRFREGGGAGGHNGLRSIIDELGTEKFSRLRVGHRRPGSEQVDHVLLDSRPTRTRRLDELLDAAADAVEAWAREGTNKAANRFNPFELRPADEDRARAAGRCRRAARRRRHPTDPNGLAPGPPDRGRKPEPCRIPRSAAAAAATAGSPNGSPPTSRRRHAPPRPDEERRLRCRARSTRRSPTPEPRNGTRAAGARDRGRAHAPRAARRATTQRPRPPPRSEKAVATGCPTSRYCRRCSRQPARSPACAIAWPRRRRPPRASCRADASPTGRRRYLAAALALAPAGERFVWIARDAEIGDRVAEELAAWLGDPAAVAILEPRTALAYERSELIADETAARVAALAAWRSGRARVLVASVQALLQHTIAPADLPDAPRELRPGARLAPGRAARTSCSTSATCP